MSHKLAFAYADTGVAHHAEIARQLFAKGMPEINLPRLRPFVPLGIDSCITGPSSEVSAILIGMRQYPVYVEDLMQAALDAEAMRVHQETLQ